MAEKLRENSPRIDTRNADKSNAPSNATMNVSTTTPQTTLPAPAPRKKTSSFQITSVTVVGSRLSNDGGDDSADDLDESHTEDISSEVLDISKMTDADNDYSSEDAFSSTMEPGTTSVQSLQLPVPNNGQGDASQVPVSSTSSVSTDDNNGQPERAIPWHTRFRVVKIESTEPFKRGRWICMDFLDPPPSLTDTQEREGGSGNSSAASSVHFGDSYIEIPIGQEVFYQQTDSQQHAVPVHLLQQQQQQQQQQQVDVPQQQQQHCIVPQHQIDYQTQNQPMTNIQQPVNVVTTHHGGSLPLPLTTQSVPVQQQQQQQQQQQMNEFYSMPQTASSMPANQTDFQQMQQPNMGLINQQMVMHQQQTTDFIPNIQQPIQSQMQTTQPTEFVTTNQKPQIPPGEYHVHHPTVHQQQNVGMPKVVPGVAVQGVPTSSPMHVGDYMMNTSSSQPQSTNVVVPGGDHVYPASRPSTISLTTTTSVKESAAVATEPLASNTVTVTPPVVDNLPANENEDNENTSGSSTVAIDNKIEQAMDLVKSHLMFAVREEVDVLKEKITELMDRINQLEYENSILRAAASQETLAKLAQPPPNPQPPNPSS